MEELVEIDKRLDLADNVQKQNFGEVSARKASNYRGLSTVVRSKKAVENHDDCAPTPICNMEFKSKSKKGKNFQHDVLPDTSGWPLVTKLSKLDTTSITNHLENWNLEYGKPQRLRTDGGPQFRTEFSSQWCKNNGIVHELSSPEHHQSNGHAENAVNK